MLESSTVVNDFSVDEYALDGGLILNVTSQPRTTKAAREAAVLTRSFIGPAPAVSSRPLSSLRTAVSDEAPIVVGPRRAADRVIRELATFRPLSDGWDGENATAPNQSALTDAIHFAHSAVSVPGLASRLDASLHVDGTVLLEIGGDPSGSLCFIGGSRIIYNMDSGVSGLLDFEYDVVPEALKQALLR